MKRLAAYAFIICLAFLLGFHAPASAQTADANALAIQGQGQMQSQTVVPVFNNTATAQQQQGQGQGQSQGQGQELSGNQSSVQFGDSVSTNVNPRQFPIPGQAPFAYIPSYFGPATADVNWQTMKTMARYKLDWTASDAQALLEGVKKCRWHAAKLKSKPKCLMGAMAENPVSGSLRVAVNGDAKNLNGGTLVGTNDVWSDDVEITTREILGQAILDGLKMGADTLLVTGEGAAVVMKAFGWGIGISNSVSVVSGTTGAVGNVSAGGIGISSVEAGYRSKPWLQVLYFKGMVAAAPPPPPVSLAPVPPPPAPSKLKTRARTEPPPAATPAPPVAARPAPPVAEQPATPSGAPSGAGWYKTTLGN
jgi:hypothetical protein